MTFLSISISHALPQVGLGTKQKMLLNVPERKRQRRREKEKERGRQGEKRDGGRREEGTKGKREGGRKRKKEGRKKERKRMRGKKGRKEGNNAIPGDTEPVTACICLCSHLFTDCDTESSVHLLHFGSMEC